VPLTALIAIGVVDRSGLTLHGWEKLPETIDLFAVGMLVAVAVEAGWTRRWMPIAAAPFAVAAVFVARPGSGMAPGDPPTAALFDVLVAAAFGLVVIGIVHDVRPLRFFSWRPVVALGTISYGFYLWHQTVLLYLVWDQRATNALPVAARTALVFAVSICLATLSWFAVERPFIALAKRKRRPGAEGPALQLANAPQP
jgi:peptidoglycan/LPS O-acetylase OafA/YrhL